MSILEELKNILQHNTSFDPGLRYFLEKMVGELVIQQKQIDDLYMIIRDED